MLEALRKLMWHEIFSILTSFEVVWVPIVNIGCFEYIASRIGNLSMRNVSSEAQDINIIGILSCWFWVQDSDIGHLICSSMRNNCTWVSHCHWYLFLIICKKERELELSLKTTQWHRNKKFRVLGCTYNYNVDDIILASWNLVRRLPQQYFFSFLIRNFANTLWQHVVFKVM